MEIIKNKNIVGGGLAIALAAIMWGFDGVVLTPRLFNLDVKLVVLILHLIPFLIMNIFLFKNYSLIKSFTAKDTLLLLAVALSGGTIGTLAIVKALFLVNFQELSIVVLLQKLQPIFAMFLAVFLLKERLTKKFLFWASVAIVSGYALTFGFSLPNLLTDTKSVHSALYAILAAFCFGSSTVFSKMILEKYSARTIGFYRYGITSLIMLVVVLLSGTITQFKDVSTANWVYFVVIGLTTGSGATFLYLYGLKHVKAVISVIIELLFPISAILFDYIFNDSKLSLVQWMSAAVMLYAIFRLNYKRKSAG